MGSENASLCNHDRKNILTDTELFWLMNIIRFGNMNTVPLTTKDSVMIDG